MKKLYVVALLLLAASVIAQTNTPPAPVPVPGPNGQGLLLALIPVIVPVIVAFLKWAIQFLPSWSLPIIASALGEVINYVSGLAGGPTTSVLNGLMLGAAGVGLREVVDQVRSKIKPQSTT